MGTLLYTRYPHTDWFKFRSWPVKLGQLLLKEFNFGASLSWKLCWGYCSIFSGACAHLWRSPLQSIRIGSPYWATPGLSVSLGPNYVFHPSFWVSSPSRAIGKFVVHPWFYERKPRQVWMFVTWENVKQFTLNSQMHKTREKWKAFQ